MADTTICPTAVERHVPLYSTSYVYVFVCQCLFAPSNNNAEGRIFFSDGMCTCTSVSRSVPMTKKELPLRSTVVVRIRNIGRFSLGEITGVVVQ